MHDYFDSIASVLDEIQADFYRDSVTILHAIERNNAGRLCQEWLPVPDPCDASECMANIPAQVKHGASDRRVGDDMTQVYFFTTIDIPQPLPWITPQMRVEHNGQQYTIKSITPDLNIATRLKVERVEL